MGLFSDGPFECHSASGFITQNGALCVDWGSNKGWGQIVFTQDRERNKIMCDSEYIGKEWIKQILCKMVDDSVELSDIKVGDKVGAWDKRVRILEGEEAQAVFNKIIEKKFGSRVFVGEHKELQLLEDRWQTKDGTIYALFSHESQNTTTDPERRWWNIDTFMLKETEDDKDVIEVITGFTRIEEWTWVAIPDPNLYPEEKGE